MKTFSDLILTILCLLFAGTPTAQTPVWEARTTQRTETMAAKTTSRLLQMNHILPRHECKIGPNTYHACQIKSIKQMKSWKNERHVCLYCDEERYLKHVKEEYYIQTLSNPAIIHERGLQDCPAAGYVQARQALQTCKARVVFCQILNSAFEIMFNAILPKCAAPLHRILY